MFILNLLYMVIKKRYLLVVPVCALAIFFVSHAALAVADGKKSENRQYKGSLFSRAEIGGRGNMAGNFDPATMAERRTKRISERAKLLGISVEEMTAKREEMMAKRAEGKDKGKISREQADARIKFMEERYKNNAGKIKGPNPKMGKMPDKRIKGAFWKKGDKANANVDNS